VSREELDGHPDWGALARASEPPLRGWIAAPLASREGRLFGWIQLSGGYDGEDFSAEDETVLVQLAQMTAIAAENTLFNEVHEVSRLKDRFLATLSHELRNPLQSILSWAHLLQDADVDGAALRRGLEVIERNARAQSRLIDDLLDVSRIISGKLALERRLVSLADVLDTALEEALPSANEKKVALLRDQAASPGVVGDPNRLRQVVVNLLSNAVKFTPAGGRVVVRLAAEGAEAEIAVEDDGKGISPEFLPHLFDPFRQADSTTTRAHKGLGIGLAIVRQLVERHGGSVRAESDGEGKGARFTVRLPVA
jgi:signal transduction histidine kinase